MNWLLAIFGRAKIYLAAAVVAVGALAAAYFRARQDGKSTAEFNQARERLKLQEKYDEIDRKTVDPDSAYERLGKLSERKDRR